MTSTGRSVSKRITALVNYGGHCRRRPATDLDADEFANYFSEKVSGIRAATEGVGLSAAATSTTVFEPVKTEADVRRVITASPSKSSSLHPIPTFLLKEVLQELRPFITALVNASLSQGRLPASQKQAIVTPLLKKAGMDVADMANYRPVSNLSFLSKMFERIVVEQLNSRQQTATAISVSIQAFPFDGNCSTSRYAGATAGHVGFSKGHL